MRAHIAFVLLGLADAQGQTCLHLAVVLGNTKLVQFMLGKGANVLETDSNVCEKLWAAGLLCDRDDEPANKPTSFCVVLHVCVCV